MKVLVDLIFNDLHHSFQRIEESQIDSNKEMWDKDDTIVGYTIYIDRLVYEEQQREINALKDKLSRLKYIMEG